MNEATSKNTKEFSRLVEYLNDLRHRYHKALCTFYAYEAMREIVAEDLLGEHEAKANADVIGEFGNFFIPTKEALRVYFFLELAKLFDASEQSLHITKVVNVAEGNLKYLTVDAFREYNRGKSDRAFLAELVEEYKGVSYDDLQNIRCMLNSNRETLEKLETYRHKWIAHDDKRKPRTPEITRDECRALLDVLAEILNSLTGKLNHETTLWDHVERDVKHDTKLVVEYLRRFEPYRLREIKSHE